MTRARVVETNEGIQSEITVEMFDRFARIMRDKGWLNVDSLHNAGLLAGRALEVGPGPGYVGLEWLKRQGENARLTGLEISPAMIEIAGRNAREYSLDGRAEYVLGNAMEMPFPDGSFDSVFSNGQGCTDARLSGSSSG
ncbi:MAG: class I SAM-dependent methyltransferase [Synergistaceae bacterium]|nr:class I SAM-dependent methyltransferase [Synergistota bacterium]NLM71726.1 class I SAM-dependent methyltransferase [Synergistaceae bacterium]